MPQAIWKGHISFGLVNVPVTLYPAETRDELNFDLLDKRDFSPIGYQKIKTSMLSSRTTTFAEPARNVPNEWTFLTL